MRPSRPASIPGCPANTGNRIPCGASAMDQRQTMTTTTIPPLRVPPEIRRQAEAVLDPGETLSGFVLDSLTRSIEYGRARQEFVARDLANSAQAKKEGRYVPADRVISKLARKLARAKQSAE